VTAALYYFGDLTGLYAAVAAEGFDALTADLHDARVSLEPGKNAVRVLAIRFGAFAFDRPNLYRTMHLPEAWAAVEESGCERGEVGIARGAL
jgi:AcrR family transcriptional regulator